MYQNKRSDILSAEKNSFTGLKRGEMEHDGTWWHSRPVPSPILVMDSQPSHSPTTRLWLPVPTIWPSPSPNGASDTLSEHRGESTLCQLLEQRDHLHHLQPESQAGWPRAHDAAFASLTQTPGTDVLVIPLAHTEHRNPDRESVRDPKYFGGVSRRK